MKRLITAVFVVGALLTFGPAANVPSAEALTTFGCCPTYDTNVDCWSGGHWHYNHCVNTCTVE